MSKKYFSNALEAMGFRSDANETAFLELQLEQLLAKSYDVEYPLPKALQLIPVNSSVPAGAASFAYMQWDRKGMAKIIANGADDIPAADANAKKFVFNIERLASSYSWTKDDLLHARFSGMPLDARRARACREAVDRLIDDLALSGNDDVGFAGFANHPNVPLTSGAAGVWSGNTALEILTDMNAVVDAIFSVTLGLHNANMLVMDPANYALIRSKPMGVNDNRSVLAVFNQNHPEVKVDYWNRLSTADAAGTGPRMIAYEKNEDVLSFFVAEAYNEEAPLPGLLKMTVVGSAKVGGCVVKLPLAMHYMDGI